MTSFINSFFSVATLLSHFLLVFCIIAFVYRKSWGKEIIKFVHQYSLWLGFGASLVAIIASLIYSNVIGFEPCTLCWWQRIFIYPQAVLFLVAIIRRDRGVWNYSLPLTLGVFLVSLYQTYTNLGGTSILPCTAVGGACSKIYVLEFGYITIPLMSLTLAVYLLFINLIAKKYEDSNS